MSRATMIVPCRDLAVARAFFARLDFAVAADFGDYLLLADGAGAELHLRHAQHERIDPAANPGGLYLHRDDVEAVAARFAGAIIGGDGALPTAWGTAEFAVDGPDGMLVRVGRAGQRDAASVTHSGSPVS